MGTLQEKSSAKSFGGWVRYYQHASTTCQCDMTFAVFIPPQAEDKKVPVLYWLSGLTCTADNFTTKAGAQRYAAEHGVMLVMPDTSPRGLSLPGEDDHWDFGSGAGFYVNATQKPWSGHYRMDAYVTEELPELIEANFPVIPGKASIFGHSMGGHGALVLALRNPGKYLSVSAFAPICEPTQVPWGEKAFSNYLGEDKEAWKSYDACHLLSQTDSAPPLLVDQGTSDSFLEVQLRPERLQDVCKEKGHELELRMHGGYDHGYYFIATFVGEHIAFHARYLCE